MGKDFFKLQDSLALFVEHKHRHVQKRLWSFSFLFFSFYILACDKTTAEYASGRKRNSFLGFSLERSSLPVGYTRT